MEAVAHHAIALQDGVGAIAILQVDQRHVVGIGQRVKDQAA
jgi:hypothetical protein